MEDGKGKAAWGSRKFDLKTSQRELVTVKYKEKVQRSILKGEEVYYIKSLSDNIYPLGRFESVMSSYT